MIIKEKKPTQCTCGWVGKFTLMSKETIKAIRAKYECRGCGNTISTLRESKT